MERDGNSPPFTPLGEVASVYNSASVRAVFAMMISHRHSWVRRVADVADRTLACPGHDQVDQINNLRSLQEGGEFAFNCLRTDPLEGLQ